MDNLTENILEVALGFKMTFHHIMYCFYDIIHKTIPDSQDNMDGATQLLTPGLKLVPKASPFKEEHSKTGPKMTQTVVLNYFPGIPKTKDN